MKKLKFKKLNDILMGINIGLVSANFIIALMFVLPTFTFQSCEPPPPPLPDCEINNYGSVTVKNSTGYNIWVDVTWGNVVENYEKLLYNSNTYKYTKIPEGTIEIWVSFDGSDWYFEYEHLSACEDMTFTWYLNARKSTGCPFVGYGPSGEEITPTLKVKE